MNLLMYLLRQAGTISGKTRLQKLVFLLQEEFKVPFGYKFEPYHLGPLSFELQAEMDWLVSHGIAVEYIIELNPSEGIRRYDYTLSEWGRDYVSKMVEPNLPHEVKEKISKGLRKWGPKSLEEILEYVHRQYPSYRLPPAHPLFE
jgi:uncharacterized protein YwgA